MKTIKTIALMALGVMVGVAGFAAPASADEWHGKRYGDRRGQEKVVVVHQRVAQPQRGGLFDRLDINNDGVVSRWEFQKRYGGSRSAQRTFNRADMNESGKLSVREVARAREMIRDLHMRG